MKFKQIHIFSEDAAIEFDLVHDYNFNNNDKIIQLGVEMPHATSQEIFLYNHGINVISPLLEITIIANTPDSQQSTTEYKKFFITEQEILEFQYVRILASEITKIKVLKPNPYLILNIGYEE